ncbi:MAG: hypothetical protein Q9191_001409 [Dirinaria sp. TL-2023a]
MLAMLRSVALLALWACSYPIDARAEFDNQTVACTTLLPSPKETQCPLISTSYASTMKSSVTVACGGNGLDMQILQPDCSSVAPSYKVTFNEGTWTSTSYFCATTADSPNYSATAAHPLEVIVTETDEPTSTLTAMADKIELKHRRWKSVYGSPASKHPRPRPTIWGSPHKPMTRSIEGPSSEEWHGHSPQPPRRRWKRIYGSLAHTQPVTVSITSSTTSVHAPASSVPCSAIDPFISEIPSTKANGTGGLFRFECGLSPQLAYECPYLCGYDVGKEMGQCFDEDRSTNTTRSDGMAYSCTHCFYPSRKVIASARGEKPTCTSIDPLHPACPPSVRFNGTDPPIRYQTACSTKAGEIQDCPFLCTAVDTPDQYRCEKADVSGTTFQPLSLIQTCVQCLPACDADA